MIEEYCPNIFRLYKNKDLIYYCIITTLPLLAINLFYVFLI